MKKTAILALVFCLACLFALTACGSGEHVHFFSEWIPIDRASCTEGGVSERYCRCGEKQTQSVSAQGHTWVIEPPLLPSCTEGGKTEGKYCSSCGEIILTQCAVAANGHSFSNVEILTQATCTELGTKKFTCSVPSCGYSYTEQYSLPTYTATELYLHSVKYVGEIVTYDKSGSALSLGTGFLISSDGKFVTNYHVIEGAHSAILTIDDVAYDVTSVLAYDANVDLAVLRIDAEGLPFATLCASTPLVGETVYAIGSSQGMTNTYSQGIVTYARRVVDGVAHVQHDASITHGNSGGPLINAYGEVIGINAWGIADSQNLNFAVSTEELLKLTYGTPLTLPEFYVKEFDAFAKLKNYIVENGSYSAEDNAYSITVGTTYSDQDSSKHARLLFYYVESNTVTLDYVINDGEYWAWFTIDAALDGSYDWNYFDYEGYEMGGAMNAATYNASTLLSYTHNNVPWSMRSSIKKLASSMISALCTFIATDLAEIRVTAKDLGFQNY